ncbi:hypothetical protein J4429_02010 [Candidatus Pacearchaeota archaeon]|nr:hypothetical protein [Candidatus Pacearchaeota archaeon]
MSVTLKNIGSEFDSLDIEDLERLSVGDVRNFDVPEERIFPMDNEVFLRDREKNPLGKAKVIECYSIDNETIGKYRVTEIYQRKK